MHSSEVGKKKGEIFVEARYAKKQKDKRVSFDPILSNDNWWNYKVAIIYKFIAPHKNDIILDFGSGSCESSEVMASEGCRVVALDISSEMLSLSKERLRRRKRSLELDYVVGDCENPPFCDNAFNKCLCWGVLHHLPNPEKALVEIHRISMSTGSLLIQEPNGLDIFRRISELKWKEPNLETSFYPWRLKALLKKSNFEIIKLDFTANPFDPTCVRADMAEVEKTPFWTLKLRLKSCLSVIMGNLFNLFFGAILVKCKKIEKRMKYACISQETL